MSINQKSAVFAATTSVLAEQGITLEAGMNAKVALGADGIKKVREIVCLGLMTGEVDMTADSKVKYSTEEAMRGYTSGLVNNHLTKDVRLNGGEKYVPKNPGARTGSSDEILKALKGLRVQQAGNEEALIAIDEAIVNRQAELAAEKAKSIEIDADKIPESLKHLLG